MKKQLILILLLVNGSILAQSSGPVVEAEARRRGVAEDQARTAERIRKEQEFNRMKGVSELTSVANTSQRNLAVPVKLSKEQKKRRLPEAEDSAKFADFLKLPQTGLFKLFPNTGCFSRNVVQVAEECKNAIPLSNYYSFQKKDYTGQTAELGLKDENFYSRGLLTNALLVNLGDIPIETVSLNSNGVKFLADYQPARNNKEVLAKQKESTEGIKDGNYQYSNSAPAIENTTYAVRVIAYQGKLLKTSWSSSWVNHNFLNNLLKEDNRKDLIVVFRTVRKSEDGSLTILWKQLQLKDSPKIELSEEDQQKYLLNLNFSISSE